MAAPTHNPVGPDSPSPCYVIASSSRALAKGTGSARLKRDGASEASFPGGKGRNQSRQQAGRRGRVELLDGHGSDQNQPLIDTGREGPGEPSSLCAQDRSPLLSLSRP